MARRRTRRKDQGDLVVGVIVLAALGGAGAWRAAESSWPLVLAVAAAVGVVLVLIWRRARAARWRTQTTLAGFLALSPTAFEAEVARVLESAGFHRMQRVGGAGDLSVDVRGRDATGRPVLVQCKRYAPGRNIGSPAIQQFYGMCHYHDPSALPIYVTTAGYTRDAITVAANAGVRLIDGSDLVALALQAQAMRQPSGALVDAPMVAPQASDRR